MTVRCGHPLYNLYVYMSAECNLACRHCWQSARYARTPRRPEFSVETCCALIDEAIPLGLHYVKISGGEPLLRPAAVIAILEHTAKRHVSVRVETNGTLIDDEVADAVQRTGAAISISLDGGTAAVHEGLRVTRGCFAATIAAIERLRRRGIRTELVFALHRGNIADFPNVIALASRLGCAAVKVNPILASGRGARMDAHGDLLGIDELQDFVRRVEREHFRGTPKVRLSTAPAFHSLSAIRAGHVAGGRCGFKNLLGVLADGRVSFCGMGYRAEQYVFMDAGRESLDHVWNDDPQLQAIRELIPNGLEGVCGNCVAKWTCQGACRAEAFEMFGSLAAPSPACQQLYDANLFPSQRLLDPDRDCRYEAANRAEAVPLPFVRGRLVGAPHAIA